MHFARHVDAVHPFVSADLQGERLVERVERDCADTQLRSLPSAAGARSPAGGHDSGNPVRPFLVHEGQRRLFA